MSKSQQDLEAAFAGESQASRKYFHFAKRAEQEGFKQVAKLFRAAAVAETVHAGNHLRALGGINDTASNLKVAIEGENYEVKVMYPEFIADAKADGDAKAERSFNYAWEVEKTHEKLYKEALDMLAKPQEDVEYYVCPVCGHTHVGKPPMNCPVCNTPGTKFEKID